MIEILAFDGDDTLWHNEAAYLEAASKFESLMATKYGLTGIDGEIYKTEKENILIFGYGVKSYTISMIETAVRLTDGRVEGRHVAEIAGYGKSILDQEIQLISGAENTVRELAALYPLTLITKGDQFEQESKIRRSGLVEYFDQIEIVSQKTTRTYANLLEKYRCHPGNFVMIGNSLRSDILPVVKLGGHAVYIPYELTWEHENMVDEPLDRGLFTQIDSLVELPAAIEKFV
jgi:putative hydrolase of the HAD superfamily